MGKYLPNWDVKFVSYPIIQFEFFNIATLIQELSQPERFSGIILTSPRSVTACQKAFSTFENKNALKVWREWKSCYTVRPSTSQKLVNLSYRLKSDTRKRSKWKSTIFIPIYFKRIHTSGLQPNRNNFIISLWKLETGNFSKKLSNSLTKVDLNPVTCYNKNPHSQLLNNLKSLS